MRIRRSELRKIIRRTITEAFNKSGYFKGNNPGPREKASQQRGLSHLGIVDFEMPRGKKSPSKDAKSAAGSREEKIRQILHDIPFEEHGSSYMRPLRDTLEKFGVKPESSEEWAWTEWYQQSEGAMDAWHVENTIPDYTTVPTHWPKRWLKYPGDPSSGFDK